MKKNIFTLMVILWMAIIFSFSAQPADESEQMSLSVGHVAGLLFADGYEDWPQERQDAFAERIDHVVRKAAHFTEYAVLGVLLALMYRPTDIRENVSSSSLPGPAPCTPPRMSSISSLWRGGAVSSRTGASIPAA